MKRLAIISADSDVLGKNLGRFPVYIYTLEKVVDLFDRVIFSTQNQNFIQKVEEKQYQNVVCSLKPRTLNDLEGITDHYFRQYRRLFDDFWWISAIHPFLEKKDIEFCIKLLDQNPSKIIATVTNQIGFYNLLLGETITTKLHDTNVLDYGIFGACREILESKQTFLKGNFETYDVGKTFQINDDMDLTIANYLFKEKLWRKYDNTKI